MIVRECQYIFVIDCSIFFYQWHVHFFDRHKLIVVNHKKQKNFNVAIMNFKNSSVYVQRQIDRLFRKHRKYARVYVNDIIVFFRIQKKHEIHLRSVFEILKQNNIFIKSIKIFIDYSFVFLFDQKIDFLRLITIDEKLKVIVRLRFSRNLRQLKSYLNLIDWMRDYVFFYVDINKSSQKRKTEMFRHDSSSDNARRIYVFMTRLKKSFQLKLIFFDALQNLLSQFFIWFMLTIKNNYS